MSDDGILVAKESFSTTINGTPRVVTKGETFREGHVITEGREEMFEPFKVDNEFETATAEPGKRRRGRGKASGAEEKAGEAAEQKQNTQGQGEREKAAFKAPEAEQAADSQDAEAAQKSVEEKTDAQTGK